MASTGFLDFSYRIVDMNKGHEHSLGNDNEIFNMHNKILITVSANRDRELRQSGILHHLRGNERKDSWRI